MNTLQSDVCKVFESLGFTDFTLRDYSDELGCFLSSATEDNAKTYVIDVVPSGLEAGLNDGIALMEKHYYQPDTKSCVKNGMKS